MKVGKVIILKYGTGIYLLVGEWDFGGKQKFPEKTSLFFSYSNSRCIDWLHGFSPQRKHVTSCDLEDAEQERAPNRVQ